MPVFWEVIRSYRRSPRALALFIFAALAIIFLLQFELLFTKSINWDEFHHLSHIFYLQDGELSRPLQSLHARLFGWLAWIPASAITQLLFARLATLVIEAAICLSIAKITEHFTNAATGWTTAVLYLASGYVFTQGFTFRADPQAAALLMGALWVVLCRPLDNKNAAFAGALIGLAGMITLKSIFYGPPLAAIALYRWNQGVPFQTAYHHFTRILFAALIAFVMIFMLHSIGLADGSAASGGKTLASGARIFTSLSLLPRLDEMVAQAWGSIPTIAVLIAGIIFWPPRKWFVALGLLLPLLSTVFYANAWPYFYTFALPPAMIVAARGVEMVGRYLDHRLLVAAAVANCFWLSAKEDREILPEQYELLHGIATFFPQRVNYFDLCGMLGGAHHREIQFMPSGWGLTLYKSKGAPQFRQAMEADAVPMIVINDAVLDATMGISDYPKTLLPFDMDTLRGNFIPHWGRVWVAGKVIVPGDEPLAVEIVTPGQYTLENRPLTLDGVSYEIGDVLTLERGIYTAAPGRTGEAMLRWGDHLHKTDLPPPLRAFGTY